MKLSVTYALTSVLKSFTQSQNRGYEVLAARAETERKIAVYHARLQEVLNQIQEEQNKLKKLETLHGKESAETNLLIQKVHQSSRSDIIEEMEKAFTFVRELKEQEESLMVLCKRHYHDVLKLTFEEKDKMAELQAEDFRRWQKIKQLDASIESAQKDADSLQFCLQLWDERNYEK